MKLSSLTKERSVWVCFPNSERGREKEEELRPVFWALRKAVRPSVGRRRRRVLLYAMLCWFVRSGLLRDRYWNHKTQLVLLFPLEEEEEERQDDDGGDKDYVCME